MTPVLRLDHHVELGALDRSVVEQPLMVHLDDVAARFADDGGEERQRSRSIVEPHPQPFDSRARPGLACQPAGVGQRTEQFVGAGRVDRASE